MDTNLPVLDIKSSPTTSDFRGHEDKDLLAVEPPVIDNDGTIFDAETILGTRNRQGQRQYLIKWAGYPHSQNTWEPEGNIFDLQLINDFEARQHKYESPRVAAFRSVFSVIDPLVPVHFSQHAIQIFTCLTMTFLVHNMSLTEPGLGPLYDCSWIRDQGVFHLSHQKAGEYTMHDTTQSSLKFYADICQPHIYHTRIPLYYCSAYLATLKCKENFFGMKSESTSTSSIPITSHTCLQAVNAKKTPYGQFTKMRKGEWQTTSRDSFLCHWIKTESESFPHFTLTAYHGELVGADPFIHQDLTLSQCLYDHFSCAPKKKSHSVLVWPK